MWQVFVFGLAFTFYYAVTIPFITTYQANNKHRSLEAAMVVERAHKKKLRDIEEAEEAAEAAAAEAE